MDYLERGSCGHDGLAGADIALDEPQHRQGTRHVFPDFSQDSLLGPGQLKREIAKESLTLPSASLPIGNAARACTLFLSRRRLR